MTDEELRYLHELEFEIERLKKYRDAPKYSNIYVLTKDMDKDVAKYFEKQDLISVSELLELIGQLDYEIEKQKKELWEMEE